jgi:hypothetical protein
MLETMITLLAVICAVSVAVMSLMRWSSAGGFRAAVHLGFAVFAGFIALANLSALIAGDESFIRTATLAYLGFATAAVLPAARALANVRYEQPEGTETRDATV